MYVEFAAECGEEDPVLVVPWAAAPDEDGPALGRTFVNLREDPWALDEIPEAEQHPPLLHALRALNASRSPVFTAKCDAWVPDEAEVESLRLDLMTDSPDCAYGFASYLDLLWRDRLPFASFHLTEQMAHALLRLAEALPFSRAAIRCVVRPALVDFEGAQEGFAVSLYVSALGYSPEDARERWGEALAAVVALLRRRTFQTRDPLRPRATV